MNKSVVERPLILCIDDAEVALRVRKLLLSSAGYSVLTVVWREGLSSSNKTRYNW